LRGVTQGAPLFGSPKIFIQTLQGGGVLGPMLIESGIEPPVILSPNLLEDSLTTDSKVFSVYARGVVRAGKRETTTRVHAVVDFRGAPAPGDVTTAAEAQEVVEDAQELSAALKPNAAGSIVYYRVD
jgi:general secretion pathway protein K